MGRVYPRVVSLVPSLSRTVIVAGLPIANLVGRTPWCVSPPGLARVRSVGGTKTPMLERIKGLRPDLVLMDREENRQEDCLALQHAGLEVFTSSVRRVEDVPPLLEQLAARLGLPAALDHARRLRRALDHPRAPARPPRVLPLIWKEPLMALAASRYGGDLLVQAGFRVALPDEGPAYPTLDPETLLALGAEWLLLASEPWAFSLLEGRELQARFPAGTRPRVRLVDGRMLTWFGTDSLAGLLAFRQLCGEMAWMTRHEA